MSDAEVCYASEEEHGFQEEDVGICVLERMGGEEVGGCDVLWVGTAALLSGNRRDSLAKLLPAHLDD